MAIYERVKEVARQRGMPLYKLEEAAGIAQGSISKWKEVSPSIEKVATVAKLLEVTVDELIN